MIQSSDSSGTQTTFTSGTGDELRANSYLLVNTIIDYFQGVVNGTNQLQFILLSGHDTTLLRLLGLYNITHPECLARNHQSMVEGTAIPFPNCIYPTYASQFIFEFYNTTDEPYLKVFYESEPVDICVNNQYKCTLTDFITLSNNLLGLTYDQYLTLCGKNPGGGGDGPKHNTLTIILITVASVLLIAVIAVVVIYYLRKRQVGMHVRNADEYNKLEEGRKEEEKSINDGN